MRIAYANAFKSLHLLATNNDTIAAKDAKWYPNVGNKILSQSYIRTEILLDQTKNAYQFGILNNQITNGQTIFSTEKRITLQDIFYVSAVGYYFNQQASSGGSTILKDHLYTHPPGFIASGSNVNTLDALWQGELQLNVNNRVVEPGWDLWRHYETPQTQYPVFGVFQANQQYPVNDEHYGSQSGMYPTEPMWILNGAYDNVLTLQYYNSINAIGLSTSVTRMVLRLVGILAQNCSKIMEPGTINPS
jgi:hypothetical protein